MKHILKRLVHLGQESGSAAIEFAFVAPVFLTLIVGMFEIGTLLVVQNAVDAAAREAARLGITGGALGNLTRSESIIEKVKETATLYSGGIIRPELIQIVVTSYPTLEGLDKPEPFVDANGNGEYDLGEFFEDVNLTGSWEADQGVSNSFGLRGEAVKYEVTYEWKPLVAIFGYKEGVTLTGRSPVLNEAFP